MGEDDGMDNTENDNTNGYNNDDAELSVDDEPQSPEINIAPNTVPQAPQPPQPPVDPTENIDDDDEYEYYEEEVEVENPELDHQTAAQVEEAFAEVDQDAVE